jgi:G3E family GTPase
VLDLKARELGGAFNMPAAGEEHGHDEEHEHDHGDGHAHHHHHHDESILSFVLSEERPLDLQRVEAWLTEVIRVAGAAIYRSKGILHVQGQGKRIVFQGVQTMFDARPDRFWNPGEKRESRLVFIGKTLDEAKIRAGFAACVAG